MAASVEVPQSPPTIPARLTVTELDAYLAAGAFDWVGDRIAELVHGEVVVSPYVRAQHSLIVRNLFLALHEHVAPRGLGKVFSDGTCFALPHRDDTIRCPDVSFVAAGRLPAEPMGEGWFAVAPDLVVEVQSPKESRRKLVGKLDDYFAAGTALAWVVEPRRRGVTAHLPDRSTRWVPEGDTLDCTPVLPDFSLAVDAVFEGVARPRVSRPRPPHDRA